ncbi:MAG TPA: CoA pyrophosphatase [Aquabacterium sp.]|mgnify:CR=1 FL=1|nr:CoA pyrophosphatase [Aquabacterium sp.]
MRRDDALRETVAGRLAAWSLLTPDTSGLKLAAVALTVADEGTGAQLRGLRQAKGWSTDAALILTRRAKTLSGHAGQWALPGGRIDEGETPEQTALRELHEEVGLALPLDAVLGRLDPFVTRSGYAIQPVVVWAGEARGLKPNPAEVASIHRIPVREFLRDDAPILEPLEGSTHPVLKMPVGDNWIAAPTAALIYQFREVCVLDRPTRVAHYEQPKFAWK